MNKLKQYLDGWLIAFLVPLIAAQSIVASGTFTFYGYMLPVPLAIAATVVIGAGIPLLEFAAVFERPGPARYGYWSGMTFLLVLECLAQYFKSQASFLTLVNQHIAEPAGVDLASFAARPEGRLLPIAYIAALSLVVVGLGYAVARRVRLIRVIAAQSASQQTELATTRAELAEIRERLAERERIIVDMRGALARVEGELASSSRRVCDLEQELANLEWENKNFREALASYHSAPPVKPPTRASIIAYVRERLAEDASLLLIARETGIPESTLRGWMEKAPANGHSTEEVIK